MLYAPRAKFTASHVADADALMRELNRAERAVATLDQNNIASLQVQPSMSVKASASMEPVSLTHDSAGDLLRTAVASTFTLPTPTEGQGWVTVEDGSSAALLLEFTTQETTQLQIIGSFQLTASATGTPHDFRWSSRLSIDGDDGSAVTTVSMYDSGSTFKVGVLVREWAVVGPGSHQIRLKIRDWRESVGSASPVSVALQWIGAIGWTR